MKATFTEGRALAGGIAVTLATLACASAADARSLAGSARADRLVGTQGADRIHGKAGRDVLRGLGGPDRIDGGKGPDGVVGGKGRDRLRGGRGRDLVKGADGRMDRRIDGGPGVDRCTVDGLAELAIARGCERVNVAPPPSGGGAGGALPATGLVVRSVDGLLCETPLPVCAFVIRGSGARSGAGVVTGVGGVVAAGAGVAVDGESWTATGVLGCTGDGFIRVRVGLDQVDVPVDCAVNL